ncbi:MAG: hypothetical protein KQH63_07890 [Desulfobulbaceae bacterium]|nr:hypothetical protein [Desulfobulbaceae bacterium]
MFRVRVIDCGIAYEFYCRKSLVEPIVMDVSSYINRLGVKSSILEFQVVVRELLTSVIEAGCENSHMHKLIMHIKKMEDQSRFEIMIKHMLDDLQFDKQKLPKGSSGAAGQLTGGEYSSLHDLDLVEDVQIGDGRRSVRVHIRVE